MLGSFQTSNHHRPTSAAPKRDTTPSRKARTSSCHRPSPAGGSTGEGDTAAGKKVRGRKGTRPRDTSASSAANATEKSFGASGAGQTRPLVVGKVFSRSPLLRTPKTRTERKAPGDAAIMSSSRAQRASSSQSAS